MSASGGGAADAMAAAEAAASLSDAVRAALVVRVKLEGKPESGITIPRKKLTPAYLKELYGIEIEFLQEEATGTVVVPPKWQSDCLPAPFEYLAKPRPDVFLDPDALETMEYRGETAIVIDHVPEVVTDKALHAWVYAGLDDEQHELAACREKMAELQRQLQVVEKQIEDLPTVMFQSVDAKEELALRRLRAQAYEKVKNETLEAIKVLQARIDQLEAEKDAVLRGMKFTRIKEHAEDKVWMWRIDFANDRKGHELAYVAVHKRNWNDFCLAVNFFSGEVAAAKFHVDVPTGWKEIGMRMVRFSRRFHGKGMFKFSGVDEGMYSGDWVYGKREGVGTFIDAKGRFQGHWAENVARGQGTMVFARGDVYRGAMGINTYHPRKSYMNGDEYADGLPNGKGVLAFVDGSVYDGHFRDGLPCGKGRYLTITGTTMEGTFNRHGLMEGDGNLMFEELSRVGNWREGFLHGRGSEVDGILGSYEGDFRYGMRHGHGIQRSKVIDGKYDGEWFMGRRTGRGILDFNGVDDAVRGSGPGAMGLDLGSTMGDGTSKGVRMPAKRNAAATAALNEGFDQRGGAPSLSNMISPELLAANNIVSDMGEEGGSSGGGGGAGGAAAAGGAGGGKKRVRIRGGGSGLMGTDPDAEGDIDAGPVDTKIGFKDANGEVKSLRYRGDYGYEGKWRAGVIRAGGVFTRRNGELNPLLYNLDLTHDGDNPRLPYIGTFRDREDAVTKDRDIRWFKSTRSVRTQRKDKEVANIERYYHWVGKAEANLDRVMERTKKLRQGVRDTRRGLVADHIFRFGRSLFDPRPEDDDIDPDNPYGDAGATRPGFGGAGGVGTGGNAPGVSMPPMPGDPTPPPPPPKAAKPDPGPPIPVGGWKHV